MTDIASTLQALIAEQMGLDPSAIPYEADFLDIGLTSLDAVTVSGALEEALGVDIDPALLFENPNINAAVAELNAMLAAHA